AKARGKLCIIENSTGSAAGKSAFCAMITELARLFKRITQQLRTKVSTARIFLGPSCIKSGILGGL
ncbi:MAG TPA: hypothetical protein VFQ00_04215, partial [Terriglobales bacterium]|nr:hypothetical protein [Terriglobales bacterium]